MRTKEGSIMVYKNISEQAKCNKCNSQMYKEGAFLDGTIQHNWMCTNRKCNNTTWSGFIQSPLPD
jgi:hypothetical protein